MKKDAKVFLDHISQSIDLIERYTQGQTKDDFLESVDLQDKVIRRLEIIGEAVKNLPEELKANHTEIPWRRAAGMRDYLIHQYFGVDLKLTWDVVERDVPELKKAIAEMKDDLQAR
ncbi:MAG: DUF86 domain-containing protein [Methanothrix sp.]|nr:DUF86 domain-containing protein [Methanothrix sp.]